MENVQLPTIFSYRITGYTGRYILKEFTNSFLNFCFLLPLVRH